MGIDSSQTIGGVVVTVGDCWELYVSEEAIRTREIPLEPALIGLLGGVEEVLVSLDTPQGTLPLNYEPIRGVLCLPAPPPPPQPEKKKGKSPSKSVNQVEPPLLALKSGLLILKCSAITPLTFQLNPPETEKEIQLSSVQPNGLTNQSKGLALQPKGLTTQPKGVTPQPNGGLTTETGVTIGFNPDDAVLLSRILHSYTPLEHFRLSLKAAELGLIAGFDTIRCLPLLHDVELLDHQTRTVRTVLNRLHGRALLCDEVGLGKTVEAGMVLLELVMRGLVRRTLILTPPSLVEQWQSELSRKFGLASITYDDPNFRLEGAAAWGQHERIIASYHTAKREPHRTAILSQHWDIIIVDEAHHFRNRTTALWQMAAKLKRQYMLLLTATPVQNNLEDLFNLVGLLQPELLSTAKSFQHQFVDRRDKLSPRNVDQLHGLLSEVMVRNRRATVGRTLPNRFVRTETVTLNETERPLYTLVSDLVRVRLR